MSRRWRMLMHEQVDLCTRLQIKSQHECILRELQFSATDGLIRALPFSDSQADSFLGWTGFQVERGAAGGGCDDGEQVEQSRAQEFRQRIDSLFPAPLYEVRGGVVKGKGKGWEAAEASVHRPWELMAWGNRTLFTRLSVAPGWSPRSGRRVG
eukprot:765974-Hanusia_phi.AAC.4